MKALETTWEKWLQRRQQNKTSIKALEATRETMVTTETTKQDINKGIGDNKGNNGYNGDNKTRH